MPLFNIGKKKEETKSPAPPTTPQNQQQNPINIVISLRQQGFDNNQIVQYLQRAGYGSTQIFDALNQANLGGNAGPVPPSQMPSNQQPPAPMEPNIPSAPEMPPPNMPSPAMPPSDTASDRERIEELTETIIDEKWEEFSKNVNKILEWKNKTEAKITALEQQFKDLKESYNKLHAAIIGKIGEYDQNIRNVGTEIKAMEKVFQKILPTFTDNVNELSRVTTNLKNKV